MSLATFVQIPIDLIRYARSLNLSGTQYDLWLYLWSKDPFGDRFVKIPSPEEIAAELGANKRTIQRAAQRLSDADLFDFQVEQWQARNTTCSTSSTKGDTKIRIRTKRSTSGQNDPDLDKNVPNVTKRSTSGQKDPNVEPDPLPNKEPSSPQTLETEQTSHTLQIAEEKEIELTTNAIGKEVASTEVLFASEIKNNSSLVQKTEVKNKKDLPAVSHGCNTIDPDWGNRRSPQEVNWRWLPFGPWNIDGKLDHNFQEWLAKKWMAKYGNDIYEAKANVLLHFKKDLTNLAAWWEAYSSQYIDKAKNLKTRIDHDCKISDEEKQQAIINVRAVLPMSEEQQQTTSKQAPVNNVEMSTTEVPERIEEQPPILEAEISDPWFEAVAAEEEACANYYASDNNADDNNTETYVTDEEGRRYKDFSGIAARQEKEISEQEHLTVAAKLSDFINKLSQKMKLKSEPQPPQPKNNLDALNQMLQDPVCRSDSSVRSKVNQYLANGYLADYDDAGYPIEVYRF